jgi:hypothetical protein
MRGKSFDPLTFIPSAAAVRKQLCETERLAERLRVLLQVAERIEAVGEPTQADSPAPADGGARGQ